MIDRSGLLDTERLREMDEYQLLTEKQKKMCIEHVLFPDLSKPELAERLKLHQMEVYRFFHSVAWEKINHELARQQLRELAQLAIKTVRKTMLNGPATAALDAAVRVLTNADLLKSASRAVVKQDNKMVVVWNEGISGDKDSVLPAPEAAGDSRLAGALQGSGGGTQIGKDDSCNK